MRFVRESGRVQAADRVKQMNKCLAYVGRYGGQQWGQLLALPTDDVFELAREVEALIEGENKANRGE
mgnify:CR=1 FL=1